MQIDREVLEQVEAALAAANLFIRNGIELGFIKMPEPDTPDPAHLTPGLVSSALARLRKAMEAKDG